MAPAKPRNYDDAVSSWERWYADIYRRDPIALGALDRLLDGLANPHPLSQREPTERELEVLAAISLGATTVEAAKRLVVQADTVKTHLRNVRAKLAAHHTTHAVAIALRRGLIE